MVIIGPLHLIHLTIAIVLLFIQIKLIQLLTDIAHKDIIFVVLKIKTKIPQSFALRYFSSYFKKLLLHS